MIRYEQYAPRFKSRAVALLDLLWGWSDAEKSTTFFEWRYEDNPYTAAPAVFIARDGERVVGLRCYVVQKFQRGADTLLVACPADAIVHPDYRRIGLFYELTQFSIEHMPPDVDVIMSLSANKASAAANRKLGWSELGMTSYMYRIGVPGFGSQERLAKDMQRRGVRFSITERPELPFPASYAWPQQQCGAQFANARDAAYYRWRYRQPFASFCSVTAETEEQRGYMILRRMARRRFSVMEYGFDGSAVLSTIVKGFTGSTGACSLRLLNLMLQDKEADAFRRAGFRDEPLWLLRLLNKHRAGALIRLTTHGSEPGSRQTIPASEVIGNDKWRIVLADVH